MTTVPKRVLADIAELQQPIYVNQGIFYEADDDNALLGYGCIFGPPGTPYEDCPMIYRFQIPPAFPFENPKVTFVTGDGKTRFHPNMYVEGKCCLSILGTWDGPRWASTMRLSTILVTLQSLLDTNPLLHEPGYNPKDEKNTDLYPQYAKKVELECIRYILNRATDTIHTYPNVFLPFKDRFLDRLSGILERLETRLIRLCETDTKILVNLPYGMTNTHTGYADLLAKVRKLRT